jgi:hypothetical protein
VHNTDHAVLLCTEACQQAASKSCEDSPWGISGWSLAQTWPASVQMGAFHVPALVAICGRHAHACSQLCTAWRSALRLHAGDIRTG